MISIVVSIYNIEKYIRQCIQSIISQTYKDWELILVDDGSNDSSPEICREYCELYENTRLIEQENRGLSGARNRGLLEAKGEYVYFVDGDDMLDKRALESFIKYLDTSPDFIIGQMMYFVDGENELIKFGKDVLDEWVRDLSGKEAFAEIYRRNKVVLMGVRGLYKRCFLLDNELFFDETKRYSEDQEWTPRCFKYANHIRCNEHCGYLYRRGRKGSLMNTQDLGKVQTILNIYDEWLVVISQNPDDEFNRALYEMLIDRYWSLYFIYQGLFTDSVYDELCSMLDSKRYYISTYKCEHKIFERIVLKTLNSNWMFKLIKTYRSLKKRLKLFAP